MKVTFGKSEPYSSGWKGWSNVVDVFVDGKKVGKLDGDYSSNRKWISYSFISEDEELMHKLRDVLPTSIMGLKDAKARVRTALEEGK